MRRIWINIHDPKDRIIVEKESKNNVPVVNNVLSKQKQRDESLMLI